jgi:hypothetical protein
MKVQGNERGWMNKQKYYLLLYENRIKNVVKNIFTRGEGNKKD